MKNANDKERFIELRAEGRSYADIAAALKVSKPTPVSYTHLTLPTIYSV